MLPANLFSNLMAKYYNCDMIDTQLSTDGWLDLSSILTGTSCRHIESRKAGLHMKAVKTHVGRCDTCGEPAAYAQLLPGGRSFRFCEQHAPLLVKKQAQATADTEQATDAKK